ncbi:MAG: alcohol dehydrogenase catalytic domain-containing protein, partial [Candidatus Rokubacteria bacterium]|nr:alcohol dehydrogenase catalytic domain-containing protein [Candidatus Rokubacteria bacterium]
MSPITGAERRPAPSPYRIWSGERRVRYPLIMGHELIGAVVSVGPGVA